MSNAIESVLVETRVFPPPERASQGASIPSMDAYKELCAQVENDFDGFWAGQARANLKWTKPFTQVLDESDAPFYRWFGDGELNVSANCLDVHLTNGNADKTAIIFEADDGKVDRVTYRELLARVCRFANGLAKLGYKKGDRAIIYMPMSIEAVVAMQACARLGVTHSVVFGGFSAKSLQERIGDVGATVVITADEQVRGGKVIPLKPAVEEAIAMGGCEAVSKVIVYRRTGGKIQWTEGRDLWMHDVEAGQPDTCEPVPVNAEHPLFILYTSGSTGKPKGVQHSSAGYLLWALLTVKWTFDARKDDVYWCTADVGWVTGHTYITYGPLAAGSDPGRVRGRAHVPERRPLLGHDRAPQGHHLLHRADRHPFADQGRRSHARGPSAQLRPGFAAHPGHGGRADQSRSLDVVSQTDRPRALPHRRHLVADRDRRPHDHAAAGRHAGRRAPARCRCRASPRPSSMRPAPMSNRAMAASWSSSALARDDPQHLGRPRALQEELLPIRVARLLPGRRRRSARRRRLFLDHGPHRRRAERLGPPPGHDGSRVGAGGA